MSKVAVNILIEEEEISQKVNVIKNSNNAESYQLIKAKSLEKEKKFI